MTTQRMTLEWVRRVQALKMQGFDVDVTVDADGVIMNIRKKSATQRQTRESA
jgi:hypothetical protein